MMLLFIILVLNQFSFANKFYSSITSKLYLVIEKNLQAHTFKEWALSPHTPELVFNDLKESLIAGNLDIPQQICNFFKSINHEQITIFESEIFNPDYEALLSPCLFQLRSQIETYYNKELNPFFKTYPQFNLNTPSHIYEIDPNKKEKLLSFRIIKKDLTQGDFYTHGNLPERHLVLTFDDGPHRTFTPLIAKILEHYGVRGMFFTIGNNVKKFPQIIKHLSKSGHSIANHSMTHPCMGSNQICGQLASFSKLKSQQEIIQTHQVIFQVLEGVDPFFRFPYGAYSPEILKWTMDHQIGVFGWNIDSLDWQANKNEFSILKRILSQLNSQKHRGILLCHDIHLRTVKMLPHLLQELSRQHYTIVLIQPLQDHLKTNHPFLENLFY